MASHSPMRPEKRYAVFSWNESKLFTPREIFNGALGSLPLLLGVSLGFYRVEEGPGHKYLRHFESGMLLYAFHKAAQKRVLLHDSHGRTLSLPLTSSIAFKVHGKEAKGAMTLSEIVERMSLPVKINFDQKENLEFVVEGARTDYNYFGKLTVVFLYEELFIRCLPVGHQDGKPRSETVLLPCRLDNIGLSVVDGLTGQTNPSEKLHKIYSDCQAAVQELDLRVDPFYKELMLISKTAQIRKEADIPNYIDENIFVGIKYKQAAHDLDISIPATSGSDRWSLPYSSLEPTYSRTYTTVKPTSRDFATSAESEYEEIYPKGWRSGSSGSALSEVDDLSIEGVLARLRDLGLDKYRKEFKKLRIDGKLLRKLSRRALEQELKMSEIDILKLTTFIAEGHVPR